MAAIISCIKCGQPAELMCGRCFERYCSKNCQLNDWYFHKKICKEMPNLISTSIVENFMELSVDNNVNKQGNPLSEVKILQANQKKLMEVSSTTVAAATNKSPKSEDATKHVKKVQETTVQVAKPLQTNVKFSDEKIPNEELPKASNKTTAEKSPKAIVESMENQEKEQQNKSKTTETLKTSKPTMRMASLLKTDHKPKRYFYKDIETKPLPEGKNLKLIVTDSSFIENSVLAVTIRDTEQLKAMAQDLKKVSEYCESIPENKRGYNPKNNEMCLAIFEEDQNWYRATCINEEEKEDDEYTLQFIDYGNLSMVPRGNILPIIEDLMFPTYNNLVRILNEPEKLTKLQAMIDQNGYIDCNTRLSSKDEMYEIFVNNLK